MRRQRLQKRALSACCVVQLTQTDAKREQHLGQGKEDQRGFGRERRCGADRFERSRSASVRSSRGGVVAFLKG
jgi:hypothetical protein